ncbi:MAG TPA: 1-acyl-sn-glycerol-3-phosphate acyltransferase [Desulfobacterales bacterium]|nr:1-acyl-sn-glycerol-3-phosphate acyltransferase [Desulfobacterales bacterium]
MKRQWIFQITKLAGLIMLRPFFSLRVEGVENLPINQSFVLLPKHQRWEDIPLLGVATPRSLFYVAKHELFRFRPIAWFLSSLGGIPLNRERPIESRRSFAKVLELLKEGEGVVIFPEGTYYKGRVGPCKKGLIKLIIGRVKVPLIPVGIRYEKKRLRTLVVVRYGIPILPPHKCEITNLVKEIMDQIYLLTFGDAKKETVL